ncbi:hypothetical protein HDU84_000782 [Entophlyctis sp. JEL0112]|nr:hypothetical protein HDU84_000782 [Entophlyctis sp. JEL0112]
MPSLTYRIVNVFASSAAALDGNPLAVFEDARAVSSSTMQALARQLNLSETTFLEPSSAAVGASMRVRIFTPGTELPFAGHPTLGSAFAVHAVTGSCSTLEMGAGVIRVKRAIDTDDDVWALYANRAKFAPPIFPLEVLARLVGLLPDDLTVPTSNALPITSVNSGIPQLMVQIASEDALGRAVCDSKLLGELNNQGVLLFVLHEDHKTVKSRFFFYENQGVIEDPGTGSACANLGRLLQREGRRGEYSLEQGHHVGRLCRIGISVQDEDVMVSGKVVQVGTGEFSF